MFTTHKFPEQYLRRLDPCPNVRKLMAQIRSEFPNFLAAEISQPGQMPSKGSAAPAPVLDNFGAGVSVKCTGSPVLENLMFFSLSQRASEPVHQSFSSGQSWQWVGRSGTRVREAPAQEKHCSNGLCPNSFSTPPPSSKRTLCGSYFRRKSVKILKQQFRLWKWIFWQLLWSNFVLRWYSDGYHDI